MMTGCQGDEPSASGTPSLTIHYTVSSDKAMYQPGEEVQINVAPAVNGTVNVRYKFTGKVIEESVISGTSFTWNPPTLDFRGYMAELFEPETEGKPEQILATIGIDISSDWTKFPRYGFLSRFDDMTELEVDNIMEYLNRHHINGIQYYDWHYKHHQPLAGTPDNPTPVYRDIINREIYFETVKKYIDAGHARNMKAMFYNLVYGALKDAAANGVQNEWYIFTNAARTEKDKHPLSPPFISDIFITDPGNTGWQQYLMDESRNVYSALPFDGFHMDQLGNRGTRYDYNGSIVNLPGGFQSFIETIDADDPARYNVLNAVNQYGQSAIAESPVDFLYTEVWGPNDTYNDLANIIIQNNSLSDQQLQTVLAAYVNYALADSPGYFNTASVLMADAVIFAFGGAHLELGEHMLGKEYFPNNNLAMPDDLKRELVVYYDFMVAYQNLLRDGGIFNDPMLIPADGKLQFKNWPAQPGNVAVVGKDFGTRQVLHLLNFTNAQTMQWRDNGGVQTVPTEVENARLRFTPPKPVAKVWYASPDFQKGASGEIDFVTTGNQISFTIPALRYWSMIVIEYH
ncbi:MAG TPA: glycoside hydrolase family 66 protein [Ohtaekwangia sp.]|nr:glycoside hydrolase family 66 protein [Ohtaekwangia sp.]